MGFFSFLFGKKDKPEKDKPVKDKLKDNPNGNNGNHYGCDFGMQNFNKTKRDRKFLEELREKQGKGKGKPPKPTDPPPPPPEPPAPEGVTVIFIDFDGSTVSGTAWNMNGDIICADAGLTPTEEETVLTAVKNKYSQFPGVLVTRSENDYKAADPARRMRVIITESWEWYGQAGGVAYVNSMFWGNDTPCFVFSSLLGYNLKNIGDAAAHEAGHTIGLRHQADWSADCTRKEAEYTQELINGQSAIMGYPYHAPSAWRVGPTPFSCTALQDDAGIISSKT